MEIFDELLDPSRDDTKYVSFQNLCHKFQRKLIGSLNGFRLCLQY